MDLTNASAIVIGGAGGFGFVTVRRLAQKGAKVVIADVSDTRGNSSPGAGRNPQPSARILDTQSVKTTSVGDARI
jgi:NAD(P)-dependent dehydrogenase (short-subunit alcohol dehydrogenase family)